MNDTASNTSAPVATISAAAENLNGLFAEPLDRMTARLAGDGDLSAPVRLPSKAALTVRLVNLDTLQRFEESRSDVGIFQNIFWMILGTSVGLLPGFLQQLPQVDKVLLAVLALLALALATFFRFWSRAEKRAADVRAKMLADAVDT